MIAGSSFETPALMYEKISTLLKFTSIGSTSTYKHINHFVTTKGQAIPKLDICWCNSGNFNLKLKNNLLARLPRKKRLHSDSKIWIKCKNIGGKLKGVSERSFSLGFICSSYFTEFLFMLQLKIPQVAKNCIDKIKQVPWKSSSIMCDVWKYCKPYLVKVELGSGAFF